MSRAARAAAVGASGFDVDVAQQLARLRHRPVIAPRACSTPGRQLEVVVPAFG